MVVQRPLEELQPRARQLTPSALGGPPCSTPCKPSGSIRCAFRVPVGRASRALSIIESVRTKLDWSSSDGDGKRGPKAPWRFKGEAGYQADLLMPGIAVRLWPINRVEKHPWVQIPTGEIGLVVAQVGAPLPIGWKSGIYKREFGQFTDVRAFIDRGGQQGVQRPVLPPGAIRAASSSGVSRSDPESQLWTAGERRISWQVRSRTLRT